MSNESINELIYKMFYEGYVLGANDYGAGDIDTDRVNKLFETFKEEIKEKLEAIQ